MIKKLIAIGMAGSFWLFSASAFAITPGNLSLTNTATLTYTGNASGIEAVATVKVNVVAGAPTLSVVADITKAENQSITTEALYTVTSTNNGFDTYTFEPSTLASGTGLTDTSGGNVDFTGVSYVYKNAGGTTITQIELGASALDVISTASVTISVPSDGVLDSEVNGLAQNDTVIIGGLPYTITGTVSDTGSGSVALTLNTAVPASLPIGTGVFETTTFTVRTDGAGGVGNQVADASTTYNVTTTLQTTLTVPAQVTATDTFQVEIVNVTIVKYVRNVTRDNCTGTCTIDITYDSGDGTGNQDFYLTGSDEINARPTEVLEYLLVVTTPASGALTAALISDVLADFTTFSSGTLRMNTDAVDDEGAGVNSDDNAFGGTFPLDPDADDGGLLIQTTAVGSADEGDGSVAGSSTIEIVYKVTVS